MSFDELSLPEDAALLSALPDLLGAEPVVVEVLVLVAGLEVVVVVLLDAAGEEEPELLPLRVDEPVAPALVAAGEAFGEEVAAGDALERAVAAGDAVAETVAVGFAVADGDAIGDIVAVAAGDAVVPGEAVGAPEAAIPA